MSAPGVEVDPACGCRVGLGEVCPRCSLVGTVDRTPSVPTATVLRPTPGSVAAELTALRAEHRRETLALHDALNRACAPLGGSPVERIEALAPDHLRASLCDALGVAADMDDADLITLVEALTVCRTSPHLPHILALLDMRAKGDEALTHLVALLRGAL